MTKHISTKAVLPECPYCHTHFSYYSAIIFDNGDAWCPECNKRIIWHLQIYPEKKGRWGKPGGEV